MYFCYYLLGKRQVSSFEPIGIPFTQGLFVTSLVENGSVILGIIFFSNFVNVFFHGPHCSPEKKIQAINKVQQRYEYTRGLVKSCYQLLLEKGMEYESYKHKHTKYKLKQTELYNRYKSWSRKAQYSFDTGLELPPKTQTAWSI